MQNFFYCIFMSKIINIYHNDWNGECLLVDNLLIRKDKNDEKGKYEIHNNELLIYWEKWNKDTFFTFNDTDYYSYDIYYKNFMKIYLIYKDSIQEIILNKEKKIFKNFEKNIEDKYIIKNNCLILFLKNTKLKYKQLYSNMYIYNDNYNKFFFDLNIQFNHQTHHYLFNKIKQTFINAKDINDVGAYLMENNDLIMTWANNETKTFYSNNYILDDRNYIENIKIIRPNKIIYDNKVLFSNISLCKKKIILTSIYYLYTPWNIDDLKITIPNNKILKKYNYQYEHYETSLNIIIELEYNNNEETIEIVYDNKTYIIHLKQLNLVETDIYAMTLFKDDYELLDQYLKYYSGIGINNFFLYYNDIIDDGFVEEIHKINNGRYNIYLLEWDYSYWWVHINNPKHHHSQTMAINDSLNILKNYSNYILYNDLDEYIKLDKMTFQDLTNQYSDIDIFIFKCIFCKMTNEKIKYEEFQKKYNENDIILGNYWDKFREKNLIKCKNINVMGVHNYVEKFNQDDNIKLWDNGIFYHYINFEEKYRPELMHQYIS